MKRWRTRSRAALTGVGMTLALAACGAGQRQDADEPPGRFTVEVRTARFPAAQRISQHTHLVIAVRNASHRTIPDVAVTICNVTCDYPAAPGQGSSAQAFAANIDQPEAANPSRPNWIVNRAPGPCRYSCRNGGAGAGVTAYTNTWALGRLRPGHTARFDWALTAVSPGRHTVAWAVAAGLDGTARAVLSDGRPPRGTFAVHISTSPPQTHLDANGQLVNAR